jgi:hypothetical protein
VKYPNPYIHSLSFMPPLACLLFLGVCRSFHPFHTYTYAYTHAHTDRHSHTVNISFFLLFCCLLASWCLLFFFHSTHTQIHTDTHT